MSGVVWLLLALFVPQAGQTKVWAALGQEYLSDYLMPRNTAAHANPYREPAHTLEFAYLRGGEKQAGPGWDLEERDRAYPAGALLPLLPFPESLAGAEACNAVMIGLFVVVLAGCLWQVARGCGAAGVRALPCLIATFGAMLLSGPMLFAYERGNSIWYAAAGTLVFLLYWDHPCRWVRMVAAVGLAVAASIKVMPALLGVVYLAPIWRTWRENRGRGICTLLVAPAFCLALGIVAFVAPWFFVAGFDSFGDWWRTGHANVAYYASRTMFGFVGLYRTAMIALHQVWEGTTGFEIARWANVVCGGGALAIAVLRMPHSRYAGVLFATAGMLLVSANMQPYTVLYLLPALLLWLQEESSSSRDKRVAVSLVEAVAWFVIWTPLQVPFVDFQLYPLQNVALLVLCGIRMNLYSESGREVEGED